MYTYFLYLHQITNIYWSQAQLKLVRERLAIASWPVRVSSVPKTLSRWRGPRFGGMLFEETWPGRDVRSHKTGHCTCRPCEVCVLPNLGPPHQDIFVA